MKGQGEEETGGGRHSKTHNDIQSTILYTVHIQSTILYTVHMHIQTIILYTVHIHIQSMM